MRISEVAEEAGVGVETVRFYERKGLIEQPRRVRGSYRTYDDQVAARIRFVRLAQAPARARPANAPSSISWPGRESRNGDDH